MNRCLITYQTIEQGDYSKEGLKILNPKLTTLNKLGYDKKQMLQEASKRAIHMSIQGAQPKLSAVLSLKESKFKLVNTGGLYILKPQNDQYESLPENEDVSMKMISSFGVKISAHGLIRTKDNSLVYWIKRFDRYGSYGRIAVEDFAQLSGQDRETKYNWSMEKLIPIIESFCSFPEIEKLKLFRLTLFCWLIGNEDMHLKNFSLIRRNKKVELSPAYDIINSSIALENDNELAIPLNGKKRKINRSEIIEYWGMERLGLNQKVIEQTLLDVKNTVPQWYDLIRRCFLPAVLKEAYLNLLNNRLDRLDLSQE